tara:strand:+ start:3979 stop:4482 length:504 start_codon:yes stop_codon:yes gene_type:complete
MAPVKPTKTAKNKTAKNKTAKKSRKTKAKSNNKKESKNKKRTNTQNVNKNAIVLVYADWCTYCKQMKPEWNEMKTRLGANMETIEIEDSDFDKDQKIRDIEEHKLNGEQLEIFGYPTMFKIHNGHVDYYGGSRTLDAMTEWATTTKGGYIKSKLKAANRSIRHKSPR